MVVPLGKDNGNVINTHMTPSKPGEYDQRRSCGGRISPGKTGVWLYSLYHIFWWLTSQYGDVSIHFDNIVQKASTPISKTNGKTSQSKFSNSVYPGTPAVPALLSELCSLEGAGGTPGRWLLMYLRRRTISSEQIRSLVRPNHCPKSRSGPGDGKG